jgi:hypothetical protein
MARYYEGDINGHFWWGIQNSSAANRFGVIGRPPDYLEYYFDEDNLEDCENEIKLIEEKLGDNLALLNEFYDVNSVDKPELTTIVKQMDESIISDYADLVLGRKIKNQIEQFGHCSFNAEL